MEKMIIRRSSLSTVVKDGFYLYMLFAMTIEIINGFFIFMGISVGSLLISGIKIVALIFGVLYIFITSRSASQIILLFMMLMSSLLIFQLINDVFEVRTLTILAKIGLNICSVYFFYYCLVNFKDYHKKIKNVILLNALIFCFNILLTYANIGFSNYTAGDGEVFGGTGFLYAGNEVGAALIACIGSVLLIVNNIKSRILFLILFWICALAIASKASLMALLIVTFFFIYYLSKLLLIGCFIFLTIALPFLWQLFSRNFELALNRWTYLIDLYGIQPFLMGGQKRIDYINQILTFYNEKPLNMLFGMSWVGEAENNFFDLFEAFGIVGIIIFILWTLILSRNIKVLRFSRMNKYKVSVISCLLLVLISFFAGHVIQSSLITPFLLLIWINEYMKVEVSELEI